MAYLDLDNMFAAPVASRGRVASPGRVDSRDTQVASDTGFSALEWNVIALAKNDSLRSLARPGRLDHVIRLVIGTSPRPHLADPRLEALRRLAVHAWRRGFALPVAEIERFLAAGFHRSQIETLVERVTGLRLAA